MEQFTVSEFLKKFRSGDSVLTRFDGRVLSSTDVVCDVCDNNIIHPGFVYYVKEDNESWALCENCKNDSERFNSSKKLLKEYRKVVDEGKIDIKAIENYTNDSILFGLRKGWYEFKDKSMTVEKYSKLSDDEKEDYPVRLTALGRENGDYNTNVLKLIEDNKFSETLFNKFDMDDNGNVTVELTKDGVRMKRLYEMSGLDFSSYIQKKLRHGVKRMFSEFIVLDKDEKHIKGQVRLQ